LEVQPGRKPTPPSVKRSRETFKLTRDIDKIELAVPHNLPQMPDWLTESDKEAWLDNIGRVATVGVAELDSALFGIYCNVLGACALAWKSGVVPPGVYLAELRRLSEFFGIAGPKSRVLNTGDSRREPNPFDRFKVRPNNEPK
jgi:hypothetical protein